MTYPGLDVTSWAGSLSLNVAPSGYSRREGDMLLSDLQGYRSLQEQTRGGAAADRTGHTLGNIWTKLDGYLGPPDNPCAPWAAFDVFAGYLVLDAWVATFMDRLLAANQRRLCHDDSD